MSSQSTTAKLTEGPVEKTIFKLAWPMILGMVGMIGFNLVDMFFIGKLGTAPLAAVSFTMPVVMVIGSLALGLGMGASAVISRAIGEGNHRLVQRLTTDSLSLALVIVAIFVAIGLMTIDPLFRLLGATDDLLPLIRTYMMIWYPGMIFLIIPMVGNNAIRATGDTKTPGMVMLGAVAINAVLDPLLIFGLGPFPRLELAGAALATLTARAITLLIALQILIVRDKMITFVIPRWKEGVASWRSILSIGLPAAGSNFILPLGTGIITRIVSGYGAEAVAGFGVATRVEMFILIVISAFSSVLSPFVGQNLGAGYLSRVKEAIRVTQRIALIWGLFNFVLLLFIAPHLAKLFNANEDVVRVAALYLSWVPLCYAMRGVMQISSSVLNVLNRPLHATALMFLWMFLLYTPMAILGSRFFGLNGVIWAAMVSGLIAGPLAYIWLRRILEHAFPDLGQ
jgi:MATE family, multidrug efflux pump